MTPAELRERAKALRREAAAMLKEADRIESEQAAEHRRAHSREALEAKTATMCRPVWASEALDGVYVVVAIEDGCFMVRNLQAVGGDVGPYPYRVRDGRYARASWLQRGDAVCLARLDPVATMLAWRAFCAARKESS